VQYVIYKDKAGEYRWYLQADNNKKIANPGEGYKNKADCEAAIKLVKGSGKAKIVDQTSS
jgi:uncharacterized protein YegP (UPF0339 family)